MGFQKDNAFFTGRLKSVSFAFKGAVKLITTEHSIMVQFSIGIFLFWNFHHRVAFSNFRHWPSDEC
jgi:hypothetical protein